MMVVLASLVALLSLLSVAACWVTYGLLRQNGRMLVRLDSLEAALDARPSDRRESRVFADRSLAASRIARTGLPAGTIAPPFQLPTIDGGQVALSDYAGRRLLLVFSDPACAPCAALLPLLEETSRRSGLPVLVISRGGVDENRRKLAESGVKLRVALQAHWEVSRLYGKFTTPMAYLIDEHGHLATGVASGAAPVLALASTGESALRLAAVSAQSAGSHLAH
jgi:peroxiredoxin